MNARFEFGKNFLEIANLRYDEEERGNQYNAAFDLRVQSNDGKFTGVGDFETDIDLIVQFLGKLEEMYDRKRASVKLESFIGCDQEVEFIFQRNGHIIVYGTASNYNHSIEFEFEADQTALPPFIKQLRAILESCGLSG